MFEVGRVNGKNATGRRTSSAWMLLIVCTFSLITAFNIWRNYDQTVLAAEGQLEAAARAGESDVTALFGSIEDYLRDLSEHSGGDFSIFVQARSSAIPEITATSIVSLDGIIRQSSRPEAVGRSVGARSYMSAFLDHQDANAMFVSDPIVSVTGTLAFFFARPLRNADGHLTAILVASVEPRILSRVLESVRPNHASGSAVVLNAHRIVLGRIPDTTPTLLGKEMQGSGLIQSHLDSGQRASVVRATAQVDGVDRFAALRSSPRFPLTVGISVSANEVLAPWVKRTTWDLIVFAVVIALSTLLLRNTKRTDSLRSANEETLRESEENLAITLHSIGDAVIATDELGQITRMNPVAERLTGWPAKFAIGKPFVEVFKIVNAATRDAAPNPVELVLESGKAVGLENHTVLIARDGSEYQISDSAAPIRNTSNAVVGVVLVFSDVSENYRAEIRLKESHAALNGILGTTLDGYWHVDAKGNLLEVNESYCLQSGYTREELIGKHIADLESAENPDEVAEHIKLIVAKGADLFESRHRKKDGTIWPVELSTAYANTGAGHFYVFIRDITERKLAVEELSASESRWKFALEGAGDGVWDWNIQSGDAAFSRRWKEMLGFAESEIQNVASEWSNRVHPNDLPRVMEALQAHIEGRTPSAVIEFRMLCKDASWRWILGRGMVVGRDAQGNALRLIGTNTDITERRRTQEINAFLAGASDKSPGEPFFDALARFLATSLQMDYVCIDRLEGDGLNATTLSVWHDGRFEVNLTYALKDTPCGDVVGQKICCFPASVCQYFPKDQALLDLCAESYVGVTLWSRNGDPIGLIAVIGRRPLLDRSHAEFTFERIAPRAALELERLITEASLQESEQRFRTLIEWTPQAIAVHRQGRVIYANPSAVQMFGAKSDKEVLGKSMLEFVHPNYRAFVLDRVKVQAASGLPVPMVEEKFVKLDNTPIDVEVQATTITYDGSPAIQVAMRDVTDYKRAEEKLRLASIVFSHAREGILITDGDGTIVDVNDTFTDITGYDRVEVLGRNPRFLKSGRQSKEFYVAMWRDLVDKGHWYGEIWNRRKDGEVYAEMTTISAVHDAEGKTRNYVGLFSDITSQKVHEQQLEHIAHFDALTNLPNRVLLADRLQQALTQAQRRQDRVAVAYLDLDGFKNINDRHGHHVGDQLLISIATKMKHALREGDTLARLGGDEFVAVLIDLEDTPDCVPMLARLLAAAADAVHVGDLTLQVSASVGVTFYPQAQELDADQLLRQADQAMYQAKLAGKNRYHAFDATLDTSLKEFHESLERIRLAMEQDEFVLYYQPKVNMRTGVIIGAEALIRWQHPDRGLLPPSAFLSVIEDHPLAVAIGEWVIDSALKQLEIWSDMGLDVSVSVNIGARQLQQIDFFDRLRSLLAEHPKAKPSSLELEILETSALEDVGQVSRLIELCAEIGVTFALDDFGTGYSSLTYLKRLRVEILKIDQSFVRDMLEDPEDLAILEGVIGLAAAFRRQVVAEGVEKTAHGTSLLHLGCEKAQGFGIARPMPAAEFPHWVATWRPDKSWV